MWLECVGGTQARAEALVVSDVDVRVVDDCIDFFSTRNTKRRKRRRKQKKKRKKEKKKEKRRLQLACRSLPPRRERPTRRRSAEPIPKRDRPIETSNSAGKKEKKGEKEREEEKERKEKKRPKEKRNRREE